MVLNLRVEKLLEQLGHDGSEVLWPDLRDPFRRRGHHIEEIQYVAWRMGAFFVPFVPRWEYNPDAAPDRRFVAYDRAEACRQVMWRTDGIMVGQYKRGSPHAVAWDSKERLIYDPEGNIIDDHTSFQCDTFYACIRGTASSP